MPSFLLGWYPDYLDPDNYTAAFAGTSGSKGMGIFFSNKDWDDLFVKEQSNTDPEVRESVFKEIQKRGPTRCPRCPSGRATCTCSPRRRQGREDRAAAAVPSTPSSSHP